MVWYREKYSSIKFDIIRQIEDNVQIHYVKPKFRKIGRLHLLWRAEEAANLAEHRAFLESKRAAQLSQRSMRCSCYVSYEAQAAY